VREIDEAESLLALDNEGSKRVYSNVCQRSQGTFLARLRQHGEYPAKVGSIRDGTQSDATCDVKDV